MRFIFAISFLLTFVGCNKKSEEKSIWVNATVFDTKDINCELPVLDFSDDSIKLRAFTGNSVFTTLIYVVKGFPSELNAKDKKVLVQIAILRPENDFICLTYGPNWPALQVLAAKAR